jgi:predicted HTH domain antitoxin
MATKAVIIEDVNILVQEGLYKDQETLFQDAFRALLRSKPELRRRLALARYKQGEISLARASEIAGVDQESFKELLREAGIPYRIIPLGKDTVKNEVNQLTQLKNGEI